METPDPADVRRALAPFDDRQQKIVTGMLSVMIREPERVRDREWITERLTEVTLLAAEFECDTPHEAVSAVQEYLRGNAFELLNASYLLFQRVGLDLAPRAETGFTFEEALRCGLGYLPPSEDGEEPDRKVKGGTPPGRDLGEQPLARLMAERDLKPADLVAASTEQLTHKMVTRATKGRRLTANTMGKVLRAWNLAAAADHGQGDLFDYKP